jgi:hypothetical protein
VCASLGRVSKGGGEKGGKRARGWCCVSLGSIPFPPPPSPLPLSSVTCPSTGSVPILFGPRCERLITAPHSGANGCTYCALACTLSRHLNPMLSFATPRCPGAISFRVVPVHTSDTGSKSHIQTRCPSGGAQAGGQCRGRSALTARDVPLLWYTKASKHTYAGDRHAKNSQYSAHVK